MLLKPILPLFLHQLLCKCCLHCWGPVSVVVATCVVSDDEPPPEVNPQAPSRHVAAPSPASSRFPVPGHPDDVRHGATALPPRHAQAALRVVVVVGRGYSPTSMSMSMHPVRMPLSA